MEIIRARTDEQINACVSVLAQLRPEIAKADFLPIIRRQMKSGYQLRYLYADGQVQCVAGFRISESLAWGKHLYVDDLVSDQHHRSQGVGQALFNALIEIANNNQCRQLHLDSGVQRFAAHRFYLRQGMRIASHHLVMDL